jgi:hypothetical protein
MATAFDHMDVNSPFLACARLLIKEHLARLPASSIPWCFARRSEGKAKLLPCTCLAAVARLESPDFSRSYRNA